MAVIDKLAVNTLKLRGAGEIFHNLERFFVSRDEALQSVSNGDYVPTAGVINAVFILGEGVVIYNFDLQDFVHITALQSAGNQANRYINLDGVNDYIEFSNAGDVLDFTKSWSVGVTLVGVTGGTGQYFMSLLSRGGVHITLGATAGSSNWGLYVTSNDSLYSADKRAQANTWVAPGDFSRLLFTYDAASKRLKYYIGNPDSGVYAMRANLLISDAMIANQNVAGGLCVGKSWAGEGGESWSGKNWNGGLNNLIVSNMVFTGPHLDEFFQSGEQFAEMELYSDVVSYCKLGEDTYPNVSDEKSQLNDGELKNGTPDDFVDIPVSESE